MNVRALMTPDPATIDADEDLDRAMALMDERAVRHLPVLSRGRFVGLLSDRDLLEATGWLPRRVREAREGTFAERRSHRVRDVMHVPAMHASPDDDLLVLSVEAAVQGLGCIPVVDGDRLVGVVTERDMLEAYLARVRREPGGWSEPPVSQLMSSPVRAIEHSAMLDDARDMCRRWTVRHLPVVDGPRLVGILSDRDLRRASGSGRRGDYPIGELMTVPPVCVPFDAPISRAAELLLSHRCSALPVVDDGDLHGIVTVEDLLDPCMKALS
jgi:CBS domain-containing protein